jgi:versiconal hemiacetal acetate esterase
MVPVTAHYSNFATLCPAYASAYKAYDENGSGVPMIDKSTMDTFFAASGLAFDDATVFTAYSDIKSQYPPTYIAVCGKDPLRDDGVVMEAMLKEAGVKTKIDSYEGLPHYFWTFPTISSSKVFLDNVVKGVHFVLRG